MSAWEARLARDQVAHLETAANLCASRRQENIFFAFMAAKRFVCSIFELRGITKHLMTCPTGNSEFYFPLTLNVPLGFASGNIEGLGEAKLTVSLGASH